MCVCLAFHRIQYPNVVPIQAIMNGAPPPLGAQQLQGAGTSVTSKQVDPAAAAAMAQQQQMAVAAAAAQATFFPWQQQQIAVAAPAPTTTEAPTPI